MWFYGHAPDAARATEQPAGHRPLNRREQGAEKPPTPPGRRTPGPGSCLPGPLSAAGILGAHVR
ncbi:hypothetical protein QJS66_18375 [Kocuria rhizophila]|nr:hypothetical protein QJS66_18375 [Kocuria rhizophila]